MATTSATPTRTRARVAPATVIAAVRRWLADFWPGAPATALPELDGMRALAVLLVMLFHAWWVWPDRYVHGPVGSEYPIGNAWVGVHLFFVLSGFLLFQPYARWLLGRGKQPSTRLFYKRRLLRVAPAYWISLLILVAFGPYTLARLLSLALHAVYLSNLTSATTYDINGVYWTMAVEVQFYALLPGLAWLMHRLAPRLSPVRALAAVIGGMVLVSAVCMLALQQPGIIHARVLGSLLVGNAALPYWLGIFGIGMACSALYVYVQQTPGAMKRLNLGERCTWATGAAVVLVALILVWRPLQDFGALDLLFGLVFGTLLLGVLFGAPAIRRVFQWRAVRFVGLISYSIYIWHYVVMRLIVDALPPIPQQVPRVLLTFALDLIFTLPVAYLSFQLTEKPFFALRRAAHD